jgi:amino acid transporter
MRLHTRITILLWLFKAHWFILLCVLGFCFTVHLSAQGFDTLLLVIALVFLWILIPSAIFLFWIAVQRAERRKTRLKPVNLTVFAMCCSLSFSVAFLQWPLRLNYNFSKPALVQEAKRIFKNQAATYPRWVGGFYVLEATAERNCVCFWTDTDLSGRTGIVYNPQGG